MARKGSCSMLEGFVAGDKQKLARSSGLKVDPAAAGKYEGAAVAVQESHAFAFRKVPDTGERQIELFR